MVFDDLARLHQRLKKEDRRVLSESEARRLLEGWDIPVVPGGQARTSEKAVALADELTYPVVLKILSPDILHKTEVGGVKLDLCSAREVESAYDEIMRSAEQNAPAARIAGVMVQQKAPEGIPLILGALRDESFGPLVMFGLGGIYTEFFADVVFRLAPVTMAEARAMLADANCYPLLTGLRGQKAADLDYIASYLVRLGEILAGDPRLQEVEINPFSLRPPAQALALDALVTLNV